MKILGAEIGGEVIPVLVDVLRDLKPILDDVREAWEAMSPEEQRELIENLGKIALIAPALSGAGRVIGGLGSGISGLAKAGKALSGLGIGTKIATMLGAGGSAGTAGASLGLTIGTSIIAGIGSALAGGAVAKVLDNYVIAPILDLFGSDSAEKYKNFNWFGEGGFFQELFDFNSLQEAVDVYGGAFKAMGEDAKKNFENMKTVITSIYGGIFDGIKSAVDGIKNYLTESWQSVVELDDRICNYLLTTITGTWDSIKEVFNSFKDGIFETFTNIYDKIKEVWDNLGAMFEAGFDLKLPHITVSGGKAPYGIGGQGSLPKFDVEWYANGGILTSPTIFGMQGGHFLGGGEAGAEAVLPLSNLQTMIVEGMTQALGNGGDTVINVSIDNNNLGSVLLTAQQMMNLRRGK